MSRLETVRENWADITTKLLRDKQLLAHFLRFSAGNVQARVFRTRDLSAEPIRNEVSKHIGRKYSTTEISKLPASGRVSLKNCVSSKRNKYSAVFELDDTGKYVNLNLVEFVGDKKNSK